MASKPVAHITQLGLITNGKVRCPAETRGVPFCLETMRDHPDVVAEAEYLDCALHLHHFGAHFDIDYEVRWRILDEEVDEEQYEDELKAMQRKEEAERARDPRIEYGGEV